MTDYHYAYLTGTLIFGIFWLILFALRKDLRREMFAVGLCIGILAPLWAPWFFNDYWQPQYAWFFGLEDFLYGFFGGGIVSVVYEEAYGKRFSMRKNRHHRWWVFLFAACLGSAAIFQFLSHIGVNSIYAALYAYLFFSAFLCHFRRDLWQDAVASGLLFVAITFVFYGIFVSLYPDIIHAWWKVHNLSGVFILGAPIEELLWAFGMGMAGGPFYEFISGRRLVRRR